MVNPPQSELLSIHILIDGISLQSRVLRVNLERIHRVFPFAATCGIELDEWAGSMKDMIHRYWSDAIKMIAVRRAQGFLSDHIGENYRPGTLSRMNPGSLSDWPVEEQQKLCAIRGNTEDSIGVRLSTALMIPIYSVSGIFSPTEESFESCQLCPRENYPGRRAPYDGGLYEREYRHKISHIS
jgi:hypothetical protein